MKTLLKLLKKTKAIFFRSFNPSKCKMSLGLAAARVNLLKNQQESAVKPMKLEIARLLTSGQDEIAWATVAHVIKEEKMIAAYELIRIYCERIIACMPLIESQRICPIDLKEPIASVIFASQKCTNVPELQDARKAFMDKYGKDFTDAAMELRPECGVSRLLVQKLSTLAPDGETKLRILSAIAAEHKVKWEPKSLFDTN